MKKSIAMAMMIIGAAAFGSPASLVVKAADKIAAKATVKTEAKRAGAVTAAHAAGKMATEASPALIAVQAKRARDRALAKSAGETVQKVATPKNILAAGGATAVVVAAHEVSDGVQSTCESIGKAAEQNPDLVPQVADSLFSTLKWFVIPVGVVIAGLFVWLIWPFMKAVRAASDFASAKCANRLARKSKENPSSGQTVVQNGVDNPAVISKPRRVNTYLLTMTAGFVLLSIIGIWRLSSGRPDNERAKKLYADVNRLSAEYVAELDRAQDEFIASVESVASERFGQVENMVQFVAARFGTLSRCAELVKSLAIDQVKGENSSEALVKNLDEDFYDALYAARDAVGKCVEEYAKRIEIAGTSYNTTLKRLGNSDEFANEGRYDAVLAKFSLKIDDSKREMSNGQIAAMFGVAIEAACVRETIKMVTKVLGKIAAREAVAVMAGGGAAVADGPLPVGDILGAIVFIGSTAWSGWDVYQATKVLPERLCESMRDAVIACKKQCVADAKNAGNRLRTIYLEAARRH